MSARFVVFVNGFPRSGKDTFVDFARKHLETFNFVHSEVSSIDPIRTFLRRQQFDVDRKTPEMRTLLAEVGDAFEKFNSTKSAYCVSSALLMTNGPHPVAVFVHVREPAMIDKISKTLAEYDFVTIRVLIDRPDSERNVQNQADQNVLNSEYDVTVNNHGSLDDLKKNAWNFAMFLTR